MPNYFFECKKEHLFEAVVPYETMLKGIQCRVKPCRCKATRVIMSPRQAQAARHFNPTLLYMRDDGEVIVPGRNDEGQLPKNYLKRIHKQGYKRVDITTFREYEEFSHKINEKLRQRAERYSAAEQEAYDAAVRQSIEFMRQGGEVEMPEILPSGQISSRVVKMPRLEDLSPQARRLAEYAIEKAKSFRFNTSDPNSYINAFENDNVKYNDRELGNWRDRH